MLEGGGQWPETSAERVGKPRPHLPANARLAIIAVSDCLARAAKRTVKLRRKVEVVAILGFDDTPAAAAAGLTTMRRGHFAEGEPHAQAVDGNEPHVMPVQLVVPET